MESGESGCRDTLTFSTLIEHLEGLDVVLDEEREEFVIRVCPYPELLLVHLADLSRVVEQPHHDSRVLQGRCEEVAWKREGEGNEREEGKTEATDGFPGGLRSEL